MSGRKSREKGARFERDVAEAFEKWLPGFKVRRSPRSGAYGTEGWSNLKGDLMFQGPKEFPYYVELKNRESWTMESLFEYDRGPLWSWVFTTWEAARAANLSPMLIFKKNRQQAFIALDCEDPVAQGLIDQGYDHMCVQNIHVFPLKTFFGWSPDDDPIGDPPEEEEEDEESEDEEPLAA